jgi:hypothetical protein
LAEITAEAHAVLREKLSDAVQRFDEAAKAVLHVPDGAWIRAAGAGRWELRVGTGVAPLATAVDEGGGRWVLTTETERKLLGSAVQARVELWTIAATVPMPAHAA